MSTMPLQWSVDIKAVAHAPGEFSYEASAGELEALKLAGVCLIGKLRRCMRNRFDIHAPLERHCAH